MAIFQEIGLTWKGREFIVPPHQVMGLIAEVEEKITIEDLALGKGVKRAKLSGAYAAALRYAARVSGAPCSVDDEDVYASLFGGDFAASTQIIIETLLRLMIPPEHLQTTSAPADPKKPKPPPARKTRKKAV